MQVGGCEMLNTADIPCGFIYRRRRRSIDTAIERNEGQRMGRMRRGEREKLRKVNGELKKRAREREISVEQRARERKTNKKKKRADQPEKKKRTKRCFILALQCSWQFRFVSGRASLLDNFSYFIYHDVIIPPIYAIFLLYNVDRLNNEPETN